MTRSTKLMLALALALTALLSWPVAAHYQAKRKLVKYKHQLQAHGEKFSLAELVPAPPPSGSNGAFALLAAAHRLESGAALFSNLAPAMKYLGSGRALVAYQQEVLVTTVSSNVWPGLSVVMTANQDALDEVRAALEKPALDFGLNYSLGQNLPVAHLASLKSLAQVLSAAAILDLHEGRSSNAWANLKSLSALGDRPRDEPLQPSELVRIAIQQIAVRTIWEALQSPAFPEPELRDLQHFWEKIDLFPQTEAVIAMQRRVSEEFYASARESFATVSSPWAKNASALAELADLGKEFVDNPRNVLTSGAYRCQYVVWKRWQSYDDEYACLEILQAGVEAARAAMKGQAIGLAREDFDRKCKLVRQAHPHAGRWNGYPSNIELVSGELLSNVAAVETQRSLLITAIALKRLHLKASHYPDNLAALIPEYLKELPPDPFSGQPLHYQLHSDSSFLLYSVGEDGQDGGGDTSAAETWKARRSWWLANDAVWPQPATPSEVQAEFDRLNLRRNPGPATRSPSPADIDIFRKRYGLTPLASQTNLPSK